MFTAIQLSWRARRQTGLNHHWLVGRAWTLVLIVMLGFAPWLAGAPTGSSMAVAVGRAAAIQSVDAVSMTVADLDRSIAFYTGVLDFTLVRQTEVAGDPYEQLYGLFGVRARVAQLRLGDEFIELTEFLAPAGLPAPLDARSNDLWFQHIAIITRDMDQAYARLRQHKVRHASPEPQRLPDWNPNAGGIKAFYFRDPDGHPLEFLEFPPGKGDPKWHRPTDALLLGIDHTAIVVSDTDVSRRFYGDHLGMRVAGGSENYGIEQARLNNVMGAHLRITTFKSASGPGIEFLQYLAPAGGRPRAADRRVNDLDHHHTYVTTDDVDALVSQAIAANYRLVSTAVADLPDDQLGFRRGALVRDADGHVVALVQR